MELKANILSYLDLVLLEGRIQIISSLKTSHSETKKELYHEAPKLTAAPAPSPKITDTPLPLVVLVVIFGVVAIVAVVSVVEATC